MLSQYHLYQHLTAEPWKPQGTDYLKLQLKDKGWLTEGVTALAKSLMAGGLAFVFYRALLNKGLGFLNLKVLNDLEKYTELSRGNLVLFFTIKAAETILFVWLGIWFVVYSSDLFDSRDNGRKEQQAALKNDAYRLSQKGKSLIKTDESGILVATVCVLYQFSSRVHESNEEISSASSNRWFKQYSSITIDEFITRLTDSSSLRSQLTLLLLSDQYVSMVSAMQNILESESLTKYFFLHDSEQKTAVSDLMAKLLEMEATDREQSIRMTEVNKQLAIVQKNQAAQETIEAYFANDFSKVQPLAANKKGRVRNIL